MKAMLATLLFVMCLTISGIVNAQTHTTLNIWPGVAPGSEHWHWKESVAHDTPEGTVAINVVTPTLTVWLPPADTATGTGVIIAPGGYCIALAIGNEGDKVAEWLQRHGIAAFVLAYRTQHKTKPGVPKDLDMDAACRYGIADAKQALKLVREHAAQWHLAADRIGILGFSAGGMVASGTLLQKDASARPAFAGLIYGAPFGRPRDIPHGLPPIFMAWAEDDTLAGNQVTKFCMQLILAGDKPEAHIYASGGHGFGMKHQGTTSDHWIDQFYDWLGAEGLLGAKR